MRLTAITVLLPVCLLAGGESAAIGRMDVQNATGHCQAALPVFDGQIRKRPLAIVNEGTSPAFVTCSLVGDYAAMNNTVLFQALVRNLGAATATINCTMIAGIDYAEGPAPAYAPQSIDVGAASQGLFSWFPPEAGGIQGTMNLSCLLPPGTAINLTLRGYDEVVGP